MTTPPLTSLAEAVKYVLDALGRYPERDALAVYAAASAGRRRPHPAFHLGHLADPADTLPPPDDFTLPPVTAPGTPEGQLARDIVGLLEPLKLLNPVSPCLSLGQGPGTLVTCFGIPLNSEAQNGPAFNKTVAQVLAEPPPDPASAGLLPEIQARIALIRANTPPAFRISLPDMQGPFNLAHAIAGGEALTLPYDDEDAFFALMDRITAFWIAARRQLCAWIGDRLSPGDRVARICECSVNLVSPDFYDRFVLPHDRRIAAEFGPLRIHPCSGPHVFHVTLDNLPVCEAEAGFIAKTAAGAIPVDEALRAIAGRPILLHIGQELPEGREYEFIRADFDRYVDTPRLLFGYTGMHWRRKDRPAIRDLHRRLDAYWAERYAGSPWSVPS